MQLSFVSGVLRFLVVNKLVCVAKNIIYMCSTEKDYLDLPEMLQFLLCFLE